jgi:hypothetical protein
MATGRTCDRCPEKDILGNFLDGELAGWYSDAQFVSVTYNSKTLGYGRPPAFQIRHIDCQMPKDPLESISAAGTVRARSCKIHSEA